MEQETYLNNELQKIAPLLLAAVEDWSALLSKMLNELGAPLAHPLSYRIKTPESIALKVTRGTVKRLSDIQDLIGFRIVTLFERDARKVAEEIEKRFHLVRGYRTDRRLQPDQFGYSARHYVLEWSKHTDVKLSTEIQVRTLAQHLWAETSHLLQYKTEAAVPRRIRRTLHRVAALLEMTDLELERALDERSLYQETIELTPSNASLDVELVRATLDAMLPSAHKTDYEIYDDLLEGLKECGIKKHKELILLIHEQLEGALEDAETQLKNLQQALIGRTPINGRIEFQRSPTHSKAHSGVTPEIIERARHGVFYSHCALVFTMLKHKYGWPHGNGQRRA